MMERELGRYIKKHEGFLPYPYMDTRGNWTVGWGHFLAKGGDPDNTEEQERVADVLTQFYDRVVLCGTPEEYAKALFYQDLRSAMKDVSDILPQEVLGRPCFTYARYVALVDMMFNLGQSEFTGFKRMLSAIEAGDWSKAADEALDSRWAEQVGDRAKRDARLLRDGTMPERWEDTT